MPWSAVTYIRPRVKKLTRPQPKKAFDRNAPDNPEQYRWFVETAREVGADDSPGALDRALDQVAGPSPLHGKAAELIRSKQTDAERELAEATARERPDPVELRRLRVRSTTSSDWRAELIRLGHLPFARLLHEPLVCGSNLQHPALRVFIGYLLSQRAGLLCSRKPVSGSKSVRHYAHLIRDGAAIVPRRFC